MEDRQIMNHVQIEPLPHDEDGTPNFDYNMLKEIFSLQKSLNEKYHYWQSLNPEQATIIYADYIIAEAVELKNEANWKIHKLTKKEFDKHHAILECIDVLKFTISNLIKLDCDAEKTLQYFIAKDKECIRRIENGY